MLTLEQLKKLQSFSVDIVINDIQQLMEIIETLNNFSLERIIISDETNIYLNANSKLKINEEEHFLEFDGAIEHEIFGHYKIPIDRIQKNIKLYRYSGMKFIKLVLNLSEITVEFLFYL